MQDLLEDTNALVQGLEAKTEKISEDTAATRALIIDGQLPQQLTPSQTVKCVRVAKVGLTNAREEAAAALAEQRVKAKEDRARRMTEAAGRTTLAVAAVEAQRADLKQQKQFLRQDRIAARGAKKTGPKAKAKAKRAPTAAKQLLTGDVD